MILKGPIGKLIISLLVKLPVFNQHYKVVQFGKTFKILKSIPIAQLKRIEINPSNILRLKFDIYDSLRLLGEHTAQVQRLDTENKQLFLNVWDNEQMNKLIRSFSLFLSNETYRQLKELLDKKVFNENLGNDYNHFISVWMRHEIKKVSSDDRKYSEGTLKYSLKPDSNKREKRMKSKFSLSKQEAIIIYSNICYWAD